MGAWIIIASNLVFALTDLRLAQGLIWQIYAVKSAQILVMIGLLAAMRRCRRWGPTVSVTLVAVWAICFLTAVSGGLTGDLATTMILLIALAWGTATILPWTAGPQVLTAIIAGAGMLLNVFLVHGDLAAAMSYPAVGAAMALAVSVLLAHQSHQGRSALERENHERNRAETELRRVLGELDSRVKERTAEFENASREQQRTAKALRASEQRFRTVSNLTSDYAYCFRVDENYRATVEWMTEASFERVTGFSTAEVEARGGGLALVHPDDMPIAVARLHNLLAGRPDVSEFRIEAKDGIRWIREHGYPELDPASGRVVRIYGAAQDVTLRRLAEEAKEEQERFLATVLDTVGALVGVVDREGRIVRINRACERVFGYRSDEVCGRLLWELAPVEKEVAPAKAVFERLLAGEWPTEYDTYWFTRAGQKVWLAWSTSFLRNEQGEVEYVIGTGLDITERKAADRALRRSEEYWRALIEHSSDLIAILAADTTLRYMSPSLHRLLGYRPEEWIGRPALELVHPDDAAAVAAALQLGMEHRDSGEPMSFRLRHADGSWRVFEGTDTNLLENEAVGGIVINCRDVTERQRGEEALRSSEQRYRDLFENANDVIYVHDLAGNFLSVNRAAEKATGYSRHEAAALNVANVVAPADLARIAQVVANAARGDVPPDVLETEIIRRDGRTAVLEVSPRIIYEDGAPVALQGIARDVTERNRAQQLTSTLLHVAGAIAGIREPDELLRRVQEKTAEALACDVVATFYQSAGSERFRLLSQHGLPERLREEAADLSFSLGEPFAGRVARGEALAINDVGSQPWLPPELCARFGIAAMVVAPLRVGDRHLGALVAVRGSEGPPFEEEHVELCVGIARQLALAMDALELYRAQQTEAEVAAAVANVARELISSLNAPTLLDRLCELTARTLGCEFSHAYVWQPDEDSFLPVSGYGDTPEQWESLRVVRLHRGVVPDLLARLERDDFARLNRDENTDDLLTDLQRRYGVSASLCMALRQGDQPTALLTAGYRTAGISFTPQQEQIARGIGRIGSLALQNARLFEELERANRLKSDFMAGMSHELRTPLNIIIGYGSLMLEETFGPLTGDQAEMLRRMQRTSCELLALIQNTLDVSRLEAGRSPLQLEDVDVEDLLLEIERETQPLWERPGLDFVCRVGQGLPLVRTDAVKLKVVLTNLVSNAIKFCSEGTIEVDAQAADGGVSIAVSDTGVGIPSANLESIFEQFERGAQTGRRSDGLGLGLYIVRRLVDLLGGRITVESQVGKGSVFRVWVPWSAEAKPANPPLPTLGASA